MSEKLRTQTENGEMRSTRRIPEPMGEAKRSRIDWQKKPRIPWGEELFKNIGVAAALLVCAVVLRSAGTATDATDAVMTAVSSDMTLDDTLGKLTFVSKLFPEAALVFGEGTDASFELPVAGGKIVHAWSENEPYLAYETTAVDVYSACDGEVMGVWHTDGEELLIEVRGNDGVTCCYGNMASSDVEMGDTVLVGNRLGQLLDGESLTFEVRSNGYSIDPANMMRGEE